MEGELKEMSESELRQLAGKLYAANQAYEQEMRRLTAATTEGKGGEESQLTPEPVRLAPVTKKNLGLQSMVAAWSGEDTVTVAEFFEGVDLVARCGNWEDQDKALVVRMRVTGAAAAFLASRADLRRPETTYADLRRALEVRFRDGVKPEQYLLQLSSLTQAADEGIGPFADRCRRVGEKAQGSESTPQEQAAARRQIDKVVLAAFLRGLRGEVGRFLRLNPPETLEEAVQKAVLAEIEFGATRHLCAVAQPAPSIVTQEATSSAPAVEVRRVERVGPECYRCGGRGHISRNCSTPRPRTDRQANRPNLESGPCFNCGRRGHIARECRESRREGNEYPKGSGPEDPRYPVRR